MNSELEKLKAILAKDVEQLTPEDRQKINEIFMQMFSSTDADDSKKVNCIWCKWEGTRADCTMVEVNSPNSAWRALGGREGYEWQCPNCKFTVDSHYTKVS